MSVRLRAVTILVGAQIITGNSLSDAAERDPVECTVRIMINPGEHSIRRSQLTMRQRNHQPPDAASVRQVLEPAW